MFRYASMPLGPVRLLTELGRALVKRGTEGTTERLRILKSGIKGNIDDFIAGLNAGANRRVADATTEYTGTMECRYKR